ncbi:hypothetical protein [Agrobacterium larrymoorei]|uniref:Uncharacterized protein n=1 Tax=Agrobacterium larrymoorei TaxID=160699 RepID=A0A4D7E6B1_9HYPH|nr:hypothetical protein [Agrobacterium larrymoorei]QCJ00871.1 hypothetical protein CFBP5473_22980 [Agrobacterium larrymoorei]QYA10206.1 hypothetical protein J5285_23650 [Agrobacterium larrymoorei]
MREIREIAVAVQPLLLDATFLILNEDTDDLQLIDDRLKAWESGARCSLDQARKRGGAYEQYISIDKAKRDFLTRRQIVTKSVAAINKVQEAHRKLADGSPDLSSSVEDINTFLDDIAELKKAIESKE